MKPELERCPFCGGRGIWQENTIQNVELKPSIWIACENQPALNPFKVGYDDRKTKCFARTNAVGIQSQNRVKGSFNSREAAEVAVALQWNTRYREGGLVKKSLNIVEIENNKKMLSSAYKEHVEHWEDKHG
jgi:hypothetical protein